MVDMLWIKTLFRVFENYTYLMHCKDKAISGVLSYNYQCAMTGDAMAASEELLMLVYRKQALNRVMTDFISSVNSLPKRWRRVVKLRSVDKKLFFEIAEELGCTIRNALYLYNRAMHALRASMTSIGYSDDVLKELLADESVMEIYKSLLESEAISACDPQDGIVAGQPVPQAQ